MLLAPLDVTPNMVFGVWAYLSELHQTKILPKAESPAMALIGEGLEALGVLSKERFMRDFTTTVGHQIFVPFEIGNPEKVPLATQITTAVHEHQHVVQYDKGVGVDFAARYLTDSTMRTLYEAEAIRAGLSVRLFLGAQVDDADLRHYVVKMQSYATSEQDREFLFRFLKLSLPTMQRGAIPDQAAQEAIRFLSR